MRIRTKVIFWLSWVVTWIVAVKILALAGFVAERSLLSLLGEGVLSIVAAIIMSYSWIFAIIMIAYLLFKFLTAISWISAFCLLMSMVLFIGTKSMTPKVDKVKQVKRKKQVATTPQQKQARPTQTQRTNTPQASTKPKVDTTRRRRRLGQ